MPLSLYLAAYIPFVRSIRSDMSHACSAFPEAFMLASKRIWLDLRELMQAMGTPAHAATPGVYNEKKCMC